eukprot:gene9443-biopygen6757
MESGFRLEWNQPPRLPWLRERNPQNNNDHKAKPSVVSAGNPTPFQSKNRLKTSSWFSETSFHRLETKPCRDRLRPEVVRRDRPVPVRGHAAVRGREHHREEGLHGDEQVGGQRRGDGERGREAPRRGWGAPADLPAPRFAGAQEPARREDGPAGSRHPPFPRERRCRLHAGGSSTSCTSRRSAGRQVPLVG